MARSDEQTNVRLPKELKDWLASRASNNRRSLTSEIVMRLEAGRQADPSAQKGEGPDRANGQPLDGSTHPA